MSETTFKIYIIKSIYLQCCALGVHLKKAGVYSTCIVTWVAKRRERVYACGMGPSLIIRAANRGKGQRDHQIFPKSSIHVGRKIEIPNDFTKRLSLVNGSLPHRIWSICLKRHGPHWFSKTTTHYDGTLCVSWLLFFFSSETARMGPNCPVF